MTDDAHRRPHKPAKSTAKTGPPGMPGADTPPLLTQDFDEGSLYELRATVAAHVTQAGMPEPHARDIVLAVHELAVNAIRHGAGHGRLLIRAHDGALHCQVTDDGKPSAPPPGAGRETQTAIHNSTPWPSQHGHGLWVIRQIADHLSVQSGPGGAIVTASFIFPPANQTRPTPRSR